MFSRHRFLLVNSGTEFGYPVLFGQLLEDYNKVKGGGAAGSAGSAHRPLTASVGHQFGILDDEPFVLFLPAQHFQRHGLEFRQLRKLNDVFAIQPQLGH